MSTQSERRISVNARPKPSGVRVRLDLRQDPNSPAAHGTLIEDPKSHDVIQSRHFVVLQVAPDWASVTGRASLSSGGQQAFTVTVDGGSAVIDLEMQHYNATLDKRAELRH